MEKHFISENANEKPFLLLEDHNDDTLRLVRFNDAAKDHVTVTFRDKEMSKVFLFNLDSDRVIFDVKKQRPIAICMYPNEQFEVNSFEVLPDNDQFNIAGHIMSGRQINEMIQSIRIHKEVQRGLDGSFARDPEEILDDLFGSVLDNDNDEDFIPVSAASTMGLHNKQSRSIQLQQEKAATEQIFIQREVHKELERSINPDHSRYLSRMLSNLTQRTQRRSDDIEL